MATTILPGAVGSVSTRSAVRVRAAALSLPSSIVSVEVPPALIDGALKAFAIVGGDDTVTSSVAGSSLLTPSAEFSAEAGMVLT